jgi:hypothetical protein
MAVCGGGSGLLGTLHSLNICFFLDLFEFLYFLDCLNFLDFWGFLGFSILGNFWILKKMFRFFLLLDHPRTLVDHPPPTTHHRGAAAP